MTRRIGSPERALPLLAVLSAAVGLALGTGVREYGGPGPEALASATAQLVSLDWQEAGGRGAPGAVAATYQVALANRGDDAVTVTEVRRSAGGGPMQDVPGADGRRVEPGRLELLVVQAPVVCPAERNGGDLIQVRVRPDRTDRASETTVDATPVGGLIALGGCQVARSTLRPGWDRPLTGTVTASTADTMTLTVTGLADTDEVTTAGSSYAAALVEVSVSGRRGDSVVLTVRSRPVEGCYNPFAAPVPVPAGLQVWTRGTTGGDEVAHYVVVGPPMARWATHLVRANCPGLFPPPGG